MKNNKKIPVILDCDPGIDDAFAIALAGSCPEFELKALTAVGGNLNLEVTFANARNIAAFLGLKVRVGKGAADPLIRTPERAEFAHGSSGMGYTSLPASKEPIEITPAWDMIHEEAAKHPGETVLIALGPLTNVALALIKYPDLKELLKEIRMMGGSAQAGNHSPHGEFNIWADPHAAQMVFASGIPVYLYGLHLTKQGPLTPGELLNISEVSGLGELFQGFIEFLFDPATPYYRKKGAILHDAITVASLMDDSLMTYRSAYVGCELTSSISLGRTVLDFSPKPGFAGNAEIAMTLNREGFLKLMQGMADHYRKSINKDSLESL